MSEETRAGRAGRKEAESIIETVHLFYQNKTAKNYLAELIRYLRYELIRRESSDE